MSHWLIKTEMGYMLEDFQGNLVKFFDMAANSKAYCMGEGIVPVYITKHSPIHLKESYEIVTNKNLWFNRSCLNDVICAGGGV